MNQLQIFTIGYKSGFGKNMKTGFGTF